MTKKSEKYKEPTLTEQQLTLLENQIIGKFMKHGVLSYATIADYLYIITKHIDPDPTAKPPSNIIETMEKL